MENKEIAFDFTDEIMNTPKLKSVPMAYQLSEDLKAAVEVALFLKQPLLLTGKPGTGKTRLAEKLAYDLHKQFSGDFIEKPLVFNTKSTSSYADLFYHYDAIGHFYNANIKEKNHDMTKSKAEDHIEINALGKAIILSNQINIDKANSYKNFKSKQKPVGSVVLIDEIDKAPRDFANDLLNELDRFEFTINETNQTFFYQNNEEKSKNIFLILTSNSEKNLPDAFLRRCIYFDIQPADDELLSKIVMAHFNNLENVHIKNYIEQFNQIRGYCTKKEPSTSELCSWIYFLHSEIKKGGNFDEINKEKKVASISILAKNEEDRKNALEALGLNEKS